MSQNALKSEVSYLHLSQEPANSDHTEERVRPDLPSFVGRTSRLDYKDKVHFSFSVSERFSSHYILIKGLIDFHRPQEIQFVFNRDEKSIEVKTSTRHVDFLYHFLQRVQDWLVQEVQFKSALKKIIQFENQYKSERDSIYKSLLGI